MKKSNANRRSLYSILKLKALNFYCLLLLLCSFNLTHAQVNSCLDFNGTDEFLLIGDVNDLGTSDFTIETWVNYDTPGTTGQYIICKGLTTIGNPSNAGYGIEINQNNGDIRFAIGHSSGVLQAAIAPGILNPNTWYHIAGVRTGSNLLLYLDGVLVATASTGFTYNTDTNIPLSIGAHNKGINGITADYLDGSMDEVRIWNVARTQGEISSNMNCAITSPEPNLMAVYNLNENSGTTAGDLSGNSNDGSFVGSPMWMCSPVAPICGNTINCECTANLSLNSSEPDKNGKATANLAINTMGIAVNSITITIPFYESLVNDDCLKFTPDKYEGFGTIKNASTISGVSGILDDPYSIGSSRKITYKFPTPTVINTVIEFDLLFPGVLDLSCCKNRVDFCFDVLIGEQDCKFCQYRVCKNNEPTELIDPSNNSFGNEPSRSQTLFKNNSDKGFTLTPNPTINKVEVKFYDQSLVGGKLELFSANGTMVKEVSEINREQVIDVSSLERGNYIVRITNNGKESSQKLVIR